MRSGPAGHTQDIHPSNLHHDESISMKCCHTESKLYLATAQFSLASCTLKSKNNNIPSMHILTVLVKAWEESRGGLSILLNGIWGRKEVHSFSGVSWQQTMWYIHYQPPTQRHMVYLKSYTDSKKYFREVVHRRDSPQTKPRELEILPCD